jgi:hypothetical protein
MNKNNAGRLTRLINLIETMGEDRKANGDIKTYRDLKALLSLLKNADKEVIVACCVPEWHNHQDDNGKLCLLGDVACTYQSWVEDAGVEHDGACQVAELASHLRNTINDLDKLIHAK